jgi:predicted DCC family thiol-disulfide oxidoreductase YuxK
MTPRAAILYDGECGFCRWTLAKILAWDRRRRMRPVAIDSAEGARLLADLPAGRRLDSWHFVDREGRVSSAGPAAAPLLRELPGGGPLAALAERFPAATARGYEWVARNRSRLGRVIPAAGKRRADRRIRRRRS